MNPYLSRLYLANEAACLSLCTSIGLEAKALDMCVRRCAVVALVALNFADLNHVGDGLRQPGVVDMVWNRPGRIEFDAVWVFTA